MYDNQAFQMEQTANCASMETTISSTTSFPPAKPQRGFQNKREEETTAYLEGCDYMKEERGIEEEEPGRSLEEKNKGRAGQAEEESEFSGFYLLGEDGGSQTEINEDECNKDRDEKDGRDSSEEKKVWRREEGVEEAGEQENRKKENEEKGGREEKVGGNKKGRDEKREDEGGWREEKDGSEREKREEDGETDICSDSKQLSTETDETGSRKQDTMKNGITGGEEQWAFPPCSGRRSRVIRLYQYDDDGQRYSHLPGPAHNEPGPVPRLKQRSLSLTRLNAIMAAASAGPLDTRQTGGEETEGPQFHMEI